MSDTPKLEEAADGGLRLTACSPSSTPEMDSAAYEATTRTVGKWIVPLAKARKMERERNEWKQHAWKESDMREKLQGEIMALVTTDHESKESFIHQVRGILSENDKDLARRALDSE